MDWFTAKESWILLPYAVAPNNHFFAILLFIRTVAKQFVQIERFLFGPMGFYWFRYTNNLCFVCANSFKQTKNKQKIVILFNLKNIDFRSLTWPKCELKWNLFHIFAFHLSAKRFSVLSFFFMLKLTVNHCFQLCTSQNLFYFNSESTFHEKNAFDGTKTHLRQHSTKIFFKVLTFNDLYYIHKNLYIREMVLFAYNLIAHSQSCTTKNIFEFPIWTGTRTHTFNQKHLSHMDVTHIVQLHSICAYTQEEGNINCCFCRQFWQW